MRDSAIPLLLAAIVFVCWTIDAWKFGVAGALRLLFRNLVVCLVFLSVWIPSMTIGEVVGWWIGGWVFDAAAVLGALVGAAAAYPVGRRLLGGYFRGEAP